MSRYCHPSLGLGNIAQPEVVDLLDKISACEARIDAAYDKLDATLLFKRSLTMTANELADMDAKTESLSEKIAQVNGALSDAANDYVSVKLENEEAIASLKKTLGDIPSTQMPESCVDMQTSKLTAHPLSSESLKLDSRYFAFSGNLEEDKLANIEKFVRSSTNNVASRSGDLCHTVCDQISDQVEQHNVCGTLIITASCTHRNVHLFSPLVIDADKAVNAWNSLKADKIDTTDPENVRRALSDGSADSIPLISGAVYGSSFIGMAHFLQSEINTTGNLDALKTNLDKKLMTGGWLANASGEMGVDRAMMDQVRAFLSSNSISCHISVVSMGAIPTIKSDEMTTCCCRLAEIDKDQLPSFDDDADSESVKSEADAARRNALLGTIRNARIGAILSAVSKSDDTKNSVLNMKTLIDALDNYIEVIGAKDQVVGVPVSFFIRRLTKAEVAKSWLRRYCPFPEPGHESH